MTTVFWGAAVHSTEMTPIHFFEDILIAIRDGKIIFVEIPKNIDALKVQYGFSSQDIKKLKAGEFLMPGFVDTHIHAPQYPNTGLGMDIGLLDWLKTYTFPEEKKYDSPNYAKALYPDVVFHTLANGTTTASYYSTIHSEASLVLCDIVEKIGQRALVGKVSMNANSPTDYIESTDKAKEDIERFVIDVLDKKNSLILPVLTPRFAPSCSSDLMHFIGNLRQKHNLHLQTHLSESKDEIAWVQQLFPDSQHYTDVYDKHNLLGSKTIMAHCVHLSTEEINVLKSKKVSVSHCPNSNLSLHSGLCDVRRLLDHGIKVGLGTDVSGGYSPSMLDSLRYTVQVSNVIDFGKENYKRIAYDEAFRLATLGGAQALALDKVIGNFEVGKDFDALLINTQNDGPICYHRLNVLQDLVQKFLWLGDDRNIQEVYVAGKKVIPCLG